MVLGYVLNVQRDKTLILYSEVNHVGARVLGQDLRGFKFNLIAGILCYFSAILIFAQR